MIDSITRLTLNLQETGSMVSIRAKRGDTGRKLRIHLSDGSYPYPISKDCYAVFTAKKPDGKCIHNPCTIDNNVIEYAFTEQTCAAVGTLKAEIRLYGADDKMITSACFLLSVYDTVFREEDEIFSESEKDTLDALILQVNALLNSPGRLLRWHGSWNEAASYTPGDLVLHQKILYVAEKAAAAGTAPGTDDTCWVSIGGSQAGGGFSPAASVTQTERGAVISITDKDGTTTATITNGKDGRNGADGAPGAKGDPGATGPQGEPGASGTDGKSAYRYALEGGYPGTEAEFSRKLASVSLRPHLVMDNDTGVITCDKTVMDCAAAAFKNGVFVYATLHTLDFSDWVRGSMICAALGEVDAEVFFELVDTDTYTGKRLLLKGTCHNGVEKWTIVSRTDGPADGFSPAAAVTQTAGGAVISITDKDGTTTATITNGKDGADGVPGPIGETGPQGEPGKDGANGKDGTSATHSWNGTVLTITSASGTSSADLRGAKGDKGDKGDTGAQGIQGIQGEPGAKGDTGAKGDKGDTGATGAAGKDGADGKDYVLTDDDRAEIATLVIETLGGNPILGIVDENNNIIVSGNLANGTYTVKYEMEDGSTVNIGNLVLDSNVYYTVTNNLTNCVTSNSATQAAKGGSYAAAITAKSGYALKSLTVTMGGNAVTVSGGAINIANVTGNIVITAVAEETVVAPGYTNLLPLAVDADGNDYVGNNGEDGYNTDYKLSSSKGTEAAQSGACVSGYIPVTAITDRIRLKNIVVSSSASVNNITFHKLDKSRFYGVAGPAGVLFTSGITADDNGVYSFSPGRWLTATEGSDLGFFRFSCGGISDETIVTVNEEIV